MSILLITPTNALLPSLRQALSAGVEIVHMTEAAAVTPALFQRPAVEAAPIEMILLHHPDCQLLAEACCHLRRSFPIDDIPLITLLDQVETRQSVFEAGATDYLLLPLLSAEIKARLSPYLRSPLQAFNGLIGITTCLKQGVVPTRAWEASLKQLAERFGAAGAWFVVANPIQETVSLAGSYNPPAKLTRDAAESRAAIWLKLKDLPVGRDLLQFERETGRINVLIRGEQSFFGLLTLSYETLPHFSLLERETLLCLGQSLGSMFEIHHIQQEIQIYATLNAFIVLVARTISEQLNLNAILSQTLEQIVPLLNASGGDIWLVSSDEEWLDLVSSLAPPATYLRAVRRPINQGLLGWVVRKQQSLQTIDPHQDPRYHAEIDCFSPAPKYSLLAVPLRHHQKVIGILTVHSDRCQPFVQRDLALVEGITSLSAPAIAHAQVMHNLSAYAEQRKALYEMSHQIAAGLELQTTLNRTLHWVGRLIEVEIGLLWFVEPGEELLRLVAVSNLDLQAQQQPIIPLGRGLVGKVAQKGRPLMLNAAAHIARLEAEMPEFLTVRPHNLMALPIIYHGQIIGVLALFNKNGSSFDEADQTLLSTALEMMAVAVGNARLHTQTISLMKERERLQRQFLQAERMATVGRLTASLSHEINNPMQAIRGALSLAIEEINDPVEVGNYLRLCLTESERVVQLIHRLRQIYRPQSDRIESIDINRLLEDVVSLAHKELKRQRINLQIDLTPELPRLTAVSNQLQLVFLNLLLNLSDRLGSVGGGKIKLHSEFSAQTRTIIIEFALSQRGVPSAEWSAIFQSTSTDENEEWNFGVSLTQNIILSHAGALSFRQREGEFVCKVELLLSGVF